MVLVSKYTLQETSAGGFGHSKCSNPRYSFPVPVGFVLGKTKYPVSTQDFPRLMSIPPLTGSVESDTS